MTLENLKGGNLCKQCSYCSENHLLLQSNTYPSQTILLKIYLDCSHSSLPQSREEDEAGVGALLESFPRNKYQ